MKFIKVNETDYVNPRNIDCVFYEEEEKEWVCLTPSGLLIIKDIEKFGKEVGVEFVYEKKEEEKCCDKCCDECIENPDREEVEPNDWRKEYADKMKEFADKMAEFSKAFNNYGADTDTNSDED